MIIEVAKENTSNYGRLTILSKWRLNITKIIDINPNCFFPKPKVESSVLHFSLKKKFKLIKNPKNLELVTRVFFNQRRKMIKNPLKQLFSNFEDIASKLNLDLCLRPQNLSIETYYKIVEEYEKLSC